MIAVRADERHRWLAAGLLGSYAALLALTRGPLEWTLAGVMLAVPLAIWVARTPNRWLGSFFALAMLAPPLRGIHPALALAAFGLVVGIARIGEWRFERTLLAASFVLFTGVLGLSVALAALYSGVDVAIESLARVGLFAIAIYVFFYTSTGAGRRSSIPLGLIYGLAIAATVFACVDFYFQFPAPAGFVSQYVWLDSGVYRRAQGLFYEASTLGNFCVFFLVMTAVALASKVGKRAVLLAGAVVFAAALIFSYSRSSLLNLGVALLALFWIKRHQLRSGVAIRRWAVRIAVAFAAGLAGVYAVFPAFGEAYGLRVWNSFSGLSSSADTVLTGRLESWSAILNFLAANPWHAILGIGYKTLPYSDFIGKPVVADNMYLSLLAETGIVGLAALFLMSFAILRSGYAAARSTSSEKSFYGAWIFCFWAGQMVQMLSVDLLTFWRVLPLYFWVMAMAVRR
jgi:O-antigen ligase